MTIAQSLGVRAALVDLAALAAIVGTLTFAKVLCLRHVVRVDLRAPPLDDPRVFAVEYLMVAVLPAMTWLLARREQHWADLGLTWPRGEAMVATATAAVGLVTVMVVMNALLRARHPTVGSPYEVIAGRWRPWLVMVVYAVLFVGLVEELMFRGFLLSRIAALFGGSRAAWYGAAVLVAAAFGLLHGGGGRLMAVNAAVSGLLLGLAYVATGNLTLVVVAHSAYDAVKVTRYLLARQPTDPS